MTLIEGKTTLNGGPLYQGKPCRTCGLTVRTQSKRCHACREAQQQDRRKGGEREKAVRIGRPATDNGARTWIFDFANTDERTAREFARRAGNDAERFLRDFAEVRDTWQAVTGLVGNTVHFRAIARHWLERIESEQG